jgi:dihydroorotate dehydrogenase electron transfer subunit
MTDQQASGGWECPAPRRLDLPLVARRAAGRAFTRLILDAPPDWYSLPGQFVNVLCESDPHAVMASEGRVLDDSDGAEWPRTTGLELSRRWPTVRRPLSVSRVVRESGVVRLDLLVRPVGSGTRFLTTRPVGSSVNVVGPLGNHFLPPADDRLCILVGGGCGVAPIFGLADYLAGMGKRTLAFLGAATVEKMPTTFRVPPEPTHARLVMTGDVEEFARSGTPTILSTDDGSAGFCGTATEALKQYLATISKGEPAAIYGCGPTPMLLALDQIARHRDLPCQVSLEGFMGCGIGVCLSCATKRRDPTNDRGWTFRLTCRDGPVVDAREMVWA